jgi:hypothetical protein
MAKLPVYDVRGRCCVGGGGGGDGCSVRLVVRVDIPPPPTVVCAVPGGGGVVKLLPSAVQAGITPTNELMGRRELPSSMRYKVSLP